MNRAEISVWNLHLAELGHEKTTTTFKAMYIELAFAEAVYGDRDGNLTEQQLRQRQQRYEDPPAGEGCWISDRRRSAPAAVRHERSEARTAVDAVRRRSEYPTVARAQGSIRVSVPRVGSGEIPDQRFPMVGRSSSSDHFSANQNLGRSALGTLLFHPLWHGGNTRRS